jgi:hypothetical protein
MFYKYSTQYYQPPLFRPKQLPHSHIPSPGSDVLLPIIR